MSTFNAQLNRSASDTIRGYVYQVDLTIKRWLELQPGESLELECGEDIDLVSYLLGQEQRRNEQVKHQTGTVNLRSAITSIANFIEQRQTNPQTKLCFLYTTTAKIGIEKYWQSLSKKNKSEAITLWEQIRKGSLKGSLQIIALQDIRALLKTINKPKKFRNETWEAYNNFRNNATDEELLDLIQSFEWKTEEIDLELLISSIQKLLKEEQGAKNDDHAKRLHEKLFVYVIRLISQSQNEKKLNLEKLTEQLCIDLNEEDRKLIDIVNRVRTLEQLYRDSRARCIVSWRAAQVPQEEAEKLADDHSVGSSPPNLNLLPGKLIILTGEMGAGKSLIAERLFQNEINKAIENNNAPIPVYLKSSQLREQKQLKTIVEVAENATNGLGNPKTQGAIIFIDGADELIDLASELLNQARFLVNAWLKTTVVITSRPLRIFDESKETIVPVPKLSKAEAYALIEKFAKQPITTASQWSQSLQSAIHLPLWAILLGIYLSEQNMRTPRSIGELLSYLVKCSLGQKKADIESANQLLQQLAIKCVEYGGSLVHYSEVVSSRAELQPILNSRLVFERSGKIGFPLAILTEWFAAQSLAAGNPDPQVLASDSEQLELWRYPLIMAIANFGHDQVSKLLTPLTEKHPAFAAQLVNEALASRFIEPDLPPWNICGERIREAMQAWVAGIDQPTEHSLAKLIAPVQDDGKVRTIGVHIESTKLITGWYYGDNLLKDVVQATNSQVSSLPVWDHIRIVERICSQTVTVPQLENQPAWAWRWTLDELVSSLSKLLEHRAIPVSKGILAHESLWKLARSLLRVSKNISLHYYPSHRPINLDILEQCLLEFPQDINRFGIGGLTLYRSDLNYLSIKVAELRETGETKLNPPWPEPDYYSVEGWPWQCYPPEKIRTYAETFYKTALNEYQKLVSIWFPKFADRLLTAAILPANIVGVITPVQYKRSPNINWHFEVLPYGEQSTVTFHFEEQDTSSNETSKVLSNKLSARLRFLLPEQNISSNKASTVLNNQLNDRLRFLRPQVYKWIDGTTYHYSSLDIFKPNSATELVYNWLWDDLKRVGWVKGLLGNPVQHW